MGGLRRQSAMQIYPGKLKGEKPDRNQGLRVVLDPSKGLKGHGVIRHSFFYHSQEKLENAGDKKKNKPEVPAELLAERDVKSSDFDFSDEATVSYIPKKDKPLVPMSTVHKKPQRILDYKTKGGIHKLAIPTNTQQTSFPGLNLCVK